MAATATTIGNPDKYPVHGTDQERAAWCEKDRALIAEGNPHPFPRFGTSAEQAAWHEKDREIRAAKKQPASVAPPANKSPAQVLVGDGLDLPEPLPPLGPYPRAGSDDDKLLWLQQCGVAHIRAGATDDSSALRAIRLEWLEITEAARERDISKLMEENLSLKQKLNRAERQVIDLTADEILQGTKAFIEREVSRQVSGLERKVAETSGHITLESSTIERLATNVMLLRGRIAELEALSPIWVQIHTGGP